MQQIKEVTPQFSLESAFVPTLTPPFWFPASKSSQCCPLVFGSGSPATPFSHLSLLPDFGSREPGTEITMEGAWAAQKHSDSFWSPQSCAALCRSAMFIPAPVPLSRSFIRLFISSAETQLSGVSSAGCHLALFVCINPFQCERAVPVPSLGWHVSSFLKLTYLKIRQLSNRIVIIVRSGTVVWTWCQNQTAFVWLNMETPPWAPTVDKAAKEAADCCIHSFVLRSCSVTCVLYLCAQMEETKISHTGRNTRRCFGEKST